MTNEEILSHFPPGCTLDEDEHGTFVRIVSGQKVYYLKAKRFGWYLGLVTGDGLDFYSVSCQPSLPAARAALAKLIAEDSRGLIEGLS